MGIVTELLDIFRKAAGIPETDHKRPILLDTTRGQHIYHDQGQNYKPLLPELNRSISTVESFAEVVLEECRRRKNQTGDFMTVIFSENGGVFYPDELARLDRWNYERCLSQQWQYLLDNLNKDMSHLRFVRMLQGLRPSIQGYGDLMREYRKVTFDGRQAVTSQPIIEGGKGGSTVEFTLETKNGNTQQAMPGDFKVDIPFTRGGEKVYELAIELDVALDDGDLKFRMVCPDIEAITEEAIADEVAAFKIAVKDKEQVLVLLDY